MACRSYCSVRLTAYDRARTDWVQLQPCNRAGIALRLRHVIGCKLMQRPMKSARLRRLVAPAPSAGSLLWGLRRLDIPDRTA